LVKDLRLPPPRTPAFVHLELTRHCNLDCFYCTIRDNNSPAPSNYSLDHFKKIIDRLVEAEVFEVSFFGGEPFLCPHIYDLGRYAVEEGLVVNFLTNGTLLRSGDIERIPRIFRSGTIALNGLEGYHDRSVGKKGAFRQAAFALSQLTEIDFPVGIDCVLSASNLNHLEQFLVWIKENLPNISKVFFNFIVPYNREESESESLSQNQTSHAFAIIDKYNRSPELRNKIGLGTAFPFCLLPKGYEHLRKNCTAGWTFGSVDASGNVRICSWSSDILGNVLTTPLEDIWQNSTGINDYRSLTWADKTCKDCSFLSSCLGGCKVTRADPPYSTASNWRTSIQALRQNEEQYGSEYAEEGIAQNLNMKYVTNTNLKIRKEKVGGLVYLKKYTRCFWANDVTIDILDKLLSGLTVGELAKSLSAEYDANTETIQQSLKNILSILKQLNVVRQTQVSNRDIQMMENEVA
jgi:radical SAM protein with 4Fe4S-binding SPASM domain